MPDLDPRPSRRDVPRAAPREAVFDIAVVVPAEGHWGDAALHLLTVLALPQVTVSTGDTPLPGSIHTCLAIGPPGWSPEPPGCTVWRLSDGDDAEAGSTDGSWETPCGNQVSLPRQHVFTVVSDGRHASTPAVGAVEQVLYWLRERLAKGSAPLPERGWREWRVALQVLDLPPWRADRLPEGIEALIEARGAKKSDASGTRPAFDRKAVLAEPVSLIEAVLEGREPAGSLMTLVRAALPHSRTAHRLVGLGVAAGLLGDQKSFQQVRAKLSGPEWARPGVAFPRYAPGREGFCYSPLVLAWRTMEARADEPDFDLPDGIAAGRHIEQPLVWRPLADGRLADSDVRLISRSLLGNWLTLHTAPCPPGSQTRLDPAAYVPAAAGLEQMWFDIFRDMEHRRGRPLIRLRPWPAGTTAAFSLRYDVDRPIGDGRLDEIVAVGRNRLGGSCMSWYHFADDPNREAQGDRLRRQSCEAGIHAQTPTDAVPGLGVTHHSAPTSDYWRGDATNHALDGTAAGYGEFLAMQTLVPRPAWLPDGNGGRVGRLWTTPIHFPLEGTTDDRSLAYFDRLVDEFRDVLARGGHAIVATHPDLNQKPLQDLLAREDLTTVWAATVGDVVERCRRVLAPGAVMVTNEAHGLGLRATSDVSDLVVEVWRPGEVVPETEVVQLAGGRHGPLAALKVDHANIARICVVVLNTVSRDPRVLKESASLRAVGHDVTIIGVADRTVRAGDETLEDGTRIRRLDLRGASPGGGQWTRRLPLAAAVAATVVLFFLPPTQLTYYLALALLPAYLLFTGVFGRIERRIAKLWQRYAGKWKGYARMYGAICDTNPHAIHCHDIHALPVTVLAKLRLRVPLVYDAHEIYEELAQASKSYARKARLKHIVCHRFVDRFITINDSIAEWYARRYPALPKATIVMNATRAAPPFIYDGRLHAAAGLSDGAKILLYQGGYAEKRGLEYLVRAAAHLPPDWTLVMMGWGKTENDLRALADEINGRVAARGSREPSARFVPAVPPQELHLSTAGATIGVIPYENVGLNHWFCTPNKLWEYPNAGVPILVSPFPELRKMVETYGHGWLLPEEQDPRLLAQMVGSLTDQEIARAREACRRFIKSENWDRNGTRVVELYEELLA